MSFGTTVADIVDATEHLPEGATLIVHDFAWEDYERLLMALDDHLKLRTTYDCGWLQIVTTSGRHERYATIIDSLILACSDALRETIEGSGRATWKRRLLSRGVEADGSYYVRNAKLLLEDRELDLDVDPPPDFVVEIDVSKDSRRKFSVYAALGVQEIWRYDGQDLQFLRLVDGTYTETPKSLSFPKLSQDLMAEAIRISRSKGQTEGRRFLKKKLRAR